MRIWQRFITVSIGHAIGPAPNRINARAYAAGSFSSIYLFRYALPPHFWVNVNNSFPSISLASRQLHCEFFIRFLSRSYLLSVVLWLKNIVLQRCSKWLFKFPEIRFERQKKRCKIKEGQKCLMINWWANKRHAKCINVWSQRLLSLLTMPKPSIWGNIEFVRV